MRTRRWVTVGAVVSAAASSACCWLPLVMVASGVSAVGAASIAGQWATDLPGEEASHRMVVDLGTLGDRWVGEFDLADFRVEDYPVEVALSGETVTLFLTAIGMEFEGTLAADGSAIIGTGRMGGEEEPLELRRVARQPEFSKGFLDLEAAADDSSLVTELSGAASELRDQFNADREKTRLLMLLSPT